VFTRSAAALLAALALAGCGAPEEPPPGVAIPADSIVRTNAPAPPPREVDERPATESPATPQPRRRARIDRGADVDGSMRLLVRKVDGFGRIVVDSEGFVLYRFDGDTPTSANCQGRCTKLWQPVLATKVTPVGEIPRIKLGIVERPGDTHQLTLGGAPLYRFVRDAAPGEATGHGVDGQWWAVTADGTRADKQATGGVGR
jgi:predicted lipoprotein with Yx(FWY)xxD motif